MRFKRFRGKIFDVELSKEEQKAADAESAKIMAEWQKCHQREMDAMILWYLHDKYKFGMGRLKDFYQYFHTSADKLTEKYELADTDDVWACTAALKEDGIDLEKWEEEYGYSRKEGDECP